MKTSAPLTAESSPCSEPCWTPLRGEALVGHILRAFIALLKGGDGLRDAVFGNHEVRGVQPRDVVTLAICHRHVQLHHSHCNADDVTVLFAILGRHPDSEAGEQ